MNRIRQNYSKECEEAINDLINNELFASYTYMSMAFYMDRNDVNLTGMSEYFQKASAKEREHAMKLMKYQNRRGGDIVLKPINKPDKTSWAVPQEAMEAALRLEKYANENLLKLHRLASDIDDPHLRNFLDREYLDEQVKLIKELGDHLSNLKLVGNGLGVYIFDKDLKK